MGIAGQREPALAGLVLMVQVLSLFRSRVISVLLDFHWKRGWMCGDCTRLLCVSALDSSMYGELLNFAMVHWFPRHRELQKQLSSKPRSHAGLDFVYWMGFMLAEVL